LFHNKVLLYSLSHVYIGKNIVVTMLVTATCNGDTIVLALGRATEIEMILSVSLNPRWPRKVQSGVAVTSDFANKHPKVFSTCLLNKSHLNLLWLLSQVLIKVVSSQLLKI